MVRTTTLLGAVALAAMLAACADHSAVGPDIDVRYDGHLDNLDSPPPPPPVDTLAATLDEGSSSSDTYFGVTFFMNRTSNMSSLMFDGEGTTPNARLMMMGDGSVRGTGELLIDGVPLALKSVTSVISNTLKACENAPVLDEEIVVTDHTEGKCGGVRLEFGGGRIVRFAIGVNTPVYVP